MPQDDLDDPIISMTEKLRFLGTLLDVPSPIETHSAYVFVSRDRALKMKKPVRLGQMDHRSLAAREHACREELRLNRQLAGDVYRGLVPLVIEPSGQLALGGHGKIVDWLIDMRCLPADRMLDEILRRGDRPTAVEMDALAARLVSFYRARQAEPARSGVYLRHLLQESGVNTQHLLQMQSHLGAADIAKLTSRAEGLIVQHREEIMQRDADRLIVEGHGDLRPEHICLVDPVVIFDRIEFSSELLMIDVFDEANYLGIECAGLGAPGIGPAIIAKLQEAGFSAPSPKLLTTYGLFRCLTRARLAIDHLREPSPRTPQKWPRQSAAYLARAADLLDTRLTGRPPDWPPA